ncbi:MAG: HIT domain-containing protein [Deltaproteobacteria bacterium]|nr:HIT domain-containing protein [Deltaproteobacteria bacterium]
MKTLWAPWRIGFILGGKPVSCFLCEEPRRGPCPESLVLAVTPHAVVMLNRYPYSNGHLLVAPLRHVSRPSDLDAAERIGLHELLVTSMDLLADAFRVEGLNAGMNLGKAAGAGIADHIHWHLVPRWIGDTNAMTVVGETRVIPEALEASWEKLRPCFAHLHRPEGE